MSGCGCEEARSKIEDLIRGELCTEDSAPIREHLAECTECRTEQQVCERLTEAVKRACAEEAPPSLRAAIESSLKNLHSA